MIRRVTGMRPPSLLVLMDRRSLDGATGDERRAWSVYVDNLVPMARLGQIEAQGNIGHAADFPTGDMPMAPDFVRVRHVERRV